MTKSEEDELRDKLESPELPEKLRLRTDVDDSQYKTDDRSWVTYSIYHSGNSARVARISIILQSESEKNLRVAKVVIDPTPDSDSYWHAPNEELSRIISELSYVKRITKRLTSRGWEVGPAKYDPRITVIRKRL